ncbi:ABC transporter permease subunit [bacterium]|nr:ABC transporter permease subunit [bacterium]NIN91444.1 ABC transporter permease subunit [bacterium]NIO17854.1 ABC transporter permease subunit [bacterium]NIO72835.1 ABC transporter permease subunit [bacterium]
MLEYIARRLLFMIPLLLGITIITFVVIHLSPGGPADMLTGLSPKVSAEAKARLHSLYGLDKPLHVQYWLWLTRLMRFDFGESFKDGRLVIMKILERLPATLLLNVLSLLLIFFIALPIGIISAVRQDSFFDKGMTVFVFLGFSVPAFWLALLLMLLFGVFLGWLPISGMHSVNFPYFSFWEKLWDVIKHLILPVFISAFGGLAYLSRYSRTSMLEVLRQDYVRTARAKGLPEKKVIYRHALRNALIPIVTLLGLSLPALIGGGFIFETIFAWPGMGRLGYQAIMARDYPVIMGVGVIAALLTLLGNLIADITYAFVDPRIRYR